MKAVMDGRLGDITSKYSLDSIISALQKHRENHIKEYDEAVADYKKLRVERAKAAYDDIVSGSTKLVTNNFGLTEPVNNTELYDRMISVFKQSKGQQSTTALRPSDSEIDLDFNQADCIFNDHWTWVASAKAVNSMYANRTSNFVSTSNVRW